jgi:membrane-associated phospholipid phosphatase
MPGWLQTIDEGALRWIAENIRTPILNALMKFYTTLGNAGILFIALAVLMMFFKNTRRSGVTALTAMTFGLIVTNLTIKPLLSRARPWVVMSDFDVLVKSSDPNSFPSGHTCAAFAFALALCLSAPERWMKIAAMAAAVLMGLSRLYVGVHFPSDVLAGAIIGSLCGLLAGWIVSWVLRWMERRRAEQKK